MEKFNKLVHFIEEEVPVKIRFKDESSLMKGLNFFMRALGPDFMKTYTTTIGYTVYFPSKAYVQEKENLALRILAHETVHMLDSKKYSPFLFSVLYLMPQIFILGVFSFPWLGYWALLFLIFALPLPSDTRFYFETRGYVINWITHSNPKAAPDLYVKYFTGWVYYKMYPFKQAVIKKLQYWRNKIDQKEDKILSKVMEMYKQAAN